MGNNFEPSTQLLNMHFFSMNIIMNHIHESAVNKSPYLLGKRFYTHFSKKRTGGRNPPFNQPVVTQPNLFCLSPVKALASDADATAARTVADSERGDEDGQGAALKKHKKHKKHKSKKSKKKKKKRDKDEKESSSESGAESEGEAKHRSRSGFKVLQVTAATCKTSDVFTVDLNTKCWRVEVL